MKTVAEHTYEETILTDNGYILDLGCRGFEFADEMTRQGYKVLCIDCDKLETDRPYYRYAIVGVLDGPVYVKKNKDPQATRITKEETAEMVMPMTIKSFSHMFGMYGKWDLIKMDIEGMEYEVIMSLTEPPAKQLSIEMHLHTGIYSDRQVMEMENKLLSLGYFPAKHDKTHAHGCGLNYWDSLFILR